MNERIKELSKQAGDYVNEAYTGPVRSKTPGKMVTLVGIHSLTKSSPS